MAPRCRALAQFLSLLGRLPTFVDPALLGEGGSFPLALPDECPLKLGNAAEDGQEELGRRLVGASKDQVLIHELDGDTLPEEQADQADESIEVAIRAMLVRIPV